MDPSALIKLSHTPEGDIMTIRHTQASTLSRKSDGYPILASVRQMDSDRNVLRISFASFQRNYLTDGRLKETVQTVEEMTVCWEPGAMVGFSLFVLNKNCN